MEFLTKTSIASTLSIRFDTNEVGVLTEAFKAAAAQRQPAQTVDISSLQDVLGLQSRGLSERLFRAMEQSAGNMKK